MKLLVALFATLFVAAAGDGCDPMTVPTAAQIEFNLPASVRSCPNLPKSPGATATDRQTAVYVDKLYLAAKVCGRNVKEIDALYRRWQTRVAAVNASGK